MIFLKCKWDLALPYLKLLNWLFHTFHGSPLPNNRAQTLQSGTQSCVIWLLLNIFISLLSYLLSCHILHHIKLLTFPQTYGRWSYWSKYTLPFSGGGLHIPNPLMLNLARWLALSNKVWVEETLATWEQNFKRQLMVPPTLFSLPPAMNT